MNQMQDRTEHSDETQAADVTSSLETESHQLWKHHRVVAMATLTIPIWLSLLILGCAWFWCGPAFLNRLFVAGLAAMAAGRFVIWGGNTGDVSGGLSAAHLAGLVLYLDALWAFVLTWHAGFLFHVPWLGVPLKAAVNEGSALLHRNRWIRHATVLGVLLFVMLPISSTGSIGGSLLGRLLGMSRAATLTIVILGSILGCGLMLLGAEVLEPWFGELNPMVRYGGIVALVVAGAILSRRYRSSTTPDI